jgi:hypothetical protein
VSVARDKNQTGGTQCHCRSGWGVDLQAVQPRFALSWVGGRVSEVSTQDAR